MLLPSTSLTSILILQQVCGGDISPWIGCDWPGLAAAFPTFSLPPSSSQVRAKHSQNSTKYRQPSFLTPTSRQPQLGWLQVYGEHLQDAHNAGSLTTAAAAATVLVLSFSQNPLFSQRIEALAWAVGHSPQNFPMVCCLVR
jgi:hypothetical protein